MEKSYTLDKHFNGIKFDFFDSHGEWISRPAVLCKNVQDLIDDIRVVQKRIAAIASRLAWMEEKDS